MACGDGPDTDNSGDTAVDPDCPSEFTPQEFLDNHLRPLCEYAATCYGDPDYTVDDCAGPLGQRIIQTSCWSPCEAGQCVAWLNSVDECMDPPGSVQQVCLDMVNCETNQ